MCRAYEGGTAESGYVRFRRADVTGLADKDGCRGRPRVVRAGALRRVEQGYEGCVCDDPVQVRILIFFFYDVSMLMPISASHA